MLMRFSVSNCLSFGYKEDGNGQLMPEEFYLYAGVSQQFRERVINYNNRNVLKFASIYGANASGKTNLIKAIEMGKQILLSTLEDEKFKDKYCRSKKQNEKHPTLFEYEFTIKEKCYAYGFTVNLNEQKVLSEWLYQLEGNKENTIFERVAEQGEYYFNEEIFTSESNCQEFHYFMKDANRVNTSLLLYELERRNLEHNDYAIFHQIFQWFDKKLVVIYPETKLGASFFLFQQLNDNLLKLLNYFDTGITNYHMTSIKESVFKQYFKEPFLAEKFLKKRNPKDIHARGILCLGETLFEFKYRDEETEIAKLQFVHGDDENYYEYGEESDGTKRLIELLYIILNDDDEKVFIIDELDRSLHPQMTRKFVETFLKFSVDNRTQLIITTHESNLMDLEILRRDEVWFAEKERDNTTSLYTLEKFKVRYDKVIARNYLSGRYGAVPVFKDFEYVWGRNADCRD